MATNPPASGKALETGPSAQSQSLSMACERSLTELASLEERCNEMEDLLRMVSHDLKEPLRSVHALCIMLERDEGSDPHDLKERYRRLRASTERMFELVGSVLNLANLGRSPLKSCRVSLQNLLEEVVEDLGSLATSKCAQIEILPLPEIEADPVMMRQLFQNLISNALKFGKPGSPLTVRIGLSKYERDSIEVCVSDDGVGIPPHQLEALFSQRRGERIASGAGSGFGLIICKRIVEAHSGRIRAESEEGKGSRFMVELPFRRQPGGDLHQ